jgi:hypothetical protein
VAAAAPAISLALPAGAAATLTIPPIHEPFTPLPSTGKPAQRTTTEQEGCAEQQIRLCDDLTPEHLDRVGSSCSSVVSSRSSPAGRGWARRRMRRRADGSDPN